MYLVVGDLPPNWLMKNNSVEHVNSDMSEPLIENQRAQNAWLLRHGLWFGDLVFYLWRGIQTVPISAVGRSHQPSKDEKQKTVNPWRCIIAPRDLPVWRPEIQPDP